MLCGREGRVTGEKKTDASAVPRDEARRNNTRRRTASTRSGVAWRRQYPRSLGYPDGDPMVAQDTRQPRQPRWQRCARQRCYVPSVSKNILKPGESSLLSLFLSLLRLGIALPSSFHSQPRLYGPLSLCFFLSLPPFSSLFFSLLLCRSLARSRRCTNRLRENRRA